MTTVEEFRMKWLGESIKFVVFYAPTPKPYDASELWTKIFGQPARTYQVLPNVVGGSQSTGAGSSAQIALVAQQGRIDLAFTAPDLGPTMSPEPPPTNLPSVSAALDEGIKLIPRLTPGLQVVRIAINCEFYSTAASPQEAAKTFAGLVPVEGIPADATDLSFQMNVRRKFTEAPYDMNRLERWGTGAQQYFQFQFMAGVQNAPIRVEERPIVTLTLDLNNAPLPGVVLSETELAPMWHDLASEVRKHLSTD